jgi:hypothetical protein
LDRSRKARAQPTQAPYNGPWTAITSPEPTTRVVIKPTGSLMRMWSGRDRQFRPADGSRPIPVDSLAQRLGNRRSSRSCTWVSATVVTPPHDCHNQGRALDFTGVRGTSQERGFTKMVLANRGRLPPNGTPLRLDPVADPVAYQMLLTAFRFGTFECECNAIGAGNKCSPKNVGDPGGFCHPSRLRR